MNERQKILCDYLLQKKDEWTSEADLACELYDFYGNAKAYLAPKEYHDTRERTILSDDIAEINADFDFEKIIISGRNGIKIASEDEFDRFIDNQFKATFKKLARIYKMAKKVKRHNQMDFGGHTVEAFLENLPETT